MKTAQTIEAHAENSAQNKPKRVRGNPAKIKPFQWKPGQSGNPGGRPKNDVAAMICRQAFENNAEEVYKGLAKRLARGEAYAIQIAADRAYGKLTDKVKLDIGGELIERLLAGRKRAAKPQPVDKK